MKHLFRIALIIVFASTFGNAQVKLKVLQPALSKWQIPVANYRLPGKLDWTMSYMTLQAALDSVGYSGLPAGGSAGQVLSKIDSTDYNVQWVTAPTPNATHTGEVTGATSLTLDKTAITNKSTVTVSTGDLILVADTSDTNNLKKVTAQSIADLVDDTNFVTLDTEQDITATKRFNYFDYQTEIGLGGIYMTDGVSNDGLVMESVGVSIFDGVNVQNSVQIGTDSIRIKNTNSKAVINKNGSIQLDRSGVTLGNKDVLIKSEIDSIFNTLSVDGLTWRGEFSADSTYLVNDVVIYSRAIWVFKVENPAGLSIPNNSNANLWIYTGSTIRYGAGVPSNSLGTTGDYYFNTTNNDFYYKGGVVYTLIANLQGAAGATGAQGIQGVQGVQGIQGVQGNDSGDSALYTFSATTSSGDPSSGFVRLNNATLSLVTNAYVSKTSNTGLVADWLSTIASSTSTNKAVVIFGRRNAFTTNYARYYLTAVNPSTDHVTFNLTYIDHVGSLNTTAGNLLVEVSRVGDKGDTGTTGDAGEDGIGFTYEGDWTFTPTDYLVNDVVRYGDSIYVCTANNTASLISDNPLDNTADWDLFLGAGQDGAAGDDGEGVPVGGTTGQLLAKVDGTDYNTEWVDAPAGGGGGGGEVRTIASNHTSSATAYAPFDVTVENGKSYRIRFLGVNRASNNASRAQFNIVVPSGDWAIGASRVYDPSNNLVETWGNVGNSSPITSNFIYNSTATGTNLRTEFDLIYTCTADGTLTIALTFTGAAAHIVWQANSKLLIEEF